MEESRAGDIIPEGLAARRGESMDEPGSALGTFARAHSGVARESVGNAREIVCQSAFAGIERHEGIHGERSIIVEATGGGSGTSIRYRK